MVHYVFKRFDCFSTFGDLSEKNALFYVFGFPFVPVASPRATASGSRHRLDDTRNHSLDLFLRGREVFCDRALAHRSWTFSFLQVTEP